MASVLASFVGLIVIPNWQLDGLKPVQIGDAEGQMISYPTPLDQDDELPGRKIYQAQGCIYCHSQQVRPANFGADMERGWGQRRSLPRDYVLQSPPLLGTMRTGPDLANIGVRQPADAWHHLHLFDARLVTAESIMPPFSYLYEETGHPPGPSGYRLPDTYRGKPSWIIPKREARQLVAYIKALRQEHSVEEVR